MKDRFSLHAKQYASFRPTYPKELYEFIMSNVKGRDCAWDCGCGNGQVANDLSPYFEKVFATDLSAKQIENAKPAANIIYSVSPAENTPFKESTFDLITVGQALHWFDIPKFYDEVKRVAKPGAMLAIWGYSLLIISPDIDQKINHFYTKIIGPYWDKERKLVDHQYQTIPFPFAEIKSPSFQFSFEWNLEHLYGYISTWSSVQKYLKEHGENPVDKLIDELRPFWRTEKQTVTFPLFLRLGKVK